MIFSGAVFSPEPGVNRTLEEEAFKLSIGQINNDTVNYPDFKLRGLIRFSDPNDDFDNIEQGKQLIIISSGEVKWRSMTESNLSLHKTGRAF